MSQATKGMIGIGMIVIGIALGIYVGIWMCFVGGIIDVIEQVRAENLSAVAVAWGIAKVIFSGFIGYACAFILAIPGYLMIGR